MISLTGAHCGKHGVIHIVIAVLSVAPDAVEISDRIEPVPDHSEVFIASEIGGIGFPDLDADGRCDGRCVDDSDFFKFACREVDELPVVHLPEFVSLAAEIFESEPDLVKRSFNI